MRVTLPLFTAKTVDQVLTHRVRNLVLAQDSCSHLEKHAVITDLIEIARERAREPDRDV